MTDILTHKISINTVARVCILPVSIWHGLLICHGKRGGVIVYDTFGSQMVYTHSNWFQHHVLMRVGVVLLTNQVLLPCTRHWGASNSSQCPSEVAILEGQKTVLRERCYFFVFCCKTVCPHIMKCMYESQILYNIIKEHLINLFIAYKQQTLTTALWKWALLTM